MFIVGGTRKHLSMVRVWFLQWIIKQLNTKCVYQRYSFPHTMRTYPERNDNTWFFGADVKTINHFRCIRCKQTIISNDIHSICLNTANGNENYLSAWKYFQHVIWSTIKICLYQRNKKAYMHNWKFGKSIDIL